MIPLRVYLKNFLCHREQEFCFDGHPVWLLYGDNGVGKSAVFDAMEHIELPGDLALEADQPWSIGLWMKPPAGSKSARIASRPAASARAGSADIFSC